MKQALVLAATALGLLGASSAAHAQAVPLIWRGTVTITAIGGPGCDQMQTAGDVGLSQYRPHLTSSDPATALTMIFGTSATGYSRLTGGVQMHGAGTAEQYSIGTLARLHFDTNTVYNFTITPSIIKATTGYVSIAGTIPAFTQTHCGMTFQGGYQRAPKVKKTL